MTSWSESRKLESIKDVVINNNKSQGRGYDKDYARFSVSKNVKINQTLYNLEASRLINKKLDIIPDTRRDRCNSVVWRARLLLNCYMKIWPRAQRQITAYFYFSLFSLLERFPHQVNMI